MKYSLCFFFLLTLLYGASASVPTSCTIPSQVSFTPAFSLAANLNQLIVNPNQLILYGENSNGQFVERYVIDSSQYTFTNNVAFETSGFQNIEIVSVGSNVIFSNVLMALANTSNSTSELYAQPLDYTSSNASIFFFTNFTDPQPEEPIYNTSGSVNGTTVVTSLVDPNMKSAQLDFADSADITSFSGFFITDNSGKISAYNGTNWTFKTVVWPLIEENNGSVYINSSDYVGFYRVNPLTHTSVLSVHLGTKLRQIVLEAHLNFTLDEFAEEHVYGMEVLLFFDANGTFIENTIVCTDCNIASLSFKTRNADTVNVVMATGTSFTKDGQTAFYYNYVSTLTPTNTFMDSFVLLDTLGLENSTGFDIDQSSVNCNLDDCDFITGLSADGTIFVMLYDPFSSSAPVVQLLILNETYLDNFEFKNVHLSTYPSVVSAYGFVVLAISSVNVNDSTDMNLSVYWNANIVPSNCADTTLFKAWLIAIIAVGGALILIFSIWGIVACCKYVKKTRATNEYFSKHAGPTIF